MFNITTKPENYRRLQSERLNDKNYHLVHASTVISCADVFVLYDNRAVVLARRKVEPAKGQLWTFGGRLRRGVLTEDFLAEIVKKESGIKIVKKSLELIGVSRTMFATDPFGHGKGTDTSNLAYFAIGRGKINLDPNHRDYLFITLDNFSKYRQKMNPYVRAGCLEALKHIEG